MRIWIMLLLGVSIVFDTFGKDRKVDLPSIRYDTLQTSWQGDSLHLDLRLRLEGPLPRGGIFVGVIPRLGRVALPGIGYFRPAEARFFRRRQALDPQSVPALSQVVLQKGRRGRAVDYSYSLLLPSQSPDSVLRLETRLFTCGSELLTDVELLPLAPRPCLCDKTRDTVFVYGDPRGILPLPVAVVSVPLYEANVTFLKPAPEKIKERTATATIRITYPVNVSRVMPSFENNASELQRIDSILRPMAADTATYRILKTNIVGYASPEDTYEHNRILSLRRATDMRNWLAEHYGLRREDISATGAGEDWDGLRAAVVGSDMRYRDEVLAVMDRYTIRQGREKKLMDLRWGRPYNYMLANFFPALRRMEFEMIYTVRAFTVAETGEILEHRPQDLSLEEIYDVARVRNNDTTIQRRRDEYGREYDIAVRYFPDDVAANINAASAALVRGDLQQARTCLDRVIDDPLAANNLGVYYWLCGDPDTAAQYFRKALQYDPVRAGHNLEELDRWRRGLHDETEK